MKFGSVSEVGEATESEGLSISLCERRSEVFTPPREKLDKQGQSRNNNEGAEKTREENKREKKRSAKLRNKTHSASMLQKEFPNERFGKIISSIQETSNMSKKKCAAFNIIADLEEANVKMTRAGGSRRVVSREDGTHIVAVESDRPFEEVTRAENVRPDLADELVKPRRFVRGETGRDQLSVMRRTSSQALQLGLPTYQARE